jgi:hypothetical protein
MYFCLSLPLKNVNGFSDRKEVAKAINAENMESWERFQVGF